MTDAAAIKRLEAAIGDINLRLNAIRAIAVGAHNVLSADHLDALAAAVQSGDMIYGNATPKWARRGKANDGDVWTLVAGLPNWVAPAGGSIDWIDNFADGSRYWAWLDLNTSGGIRTITEAGGVLTLAHTAGNGGDWWSNNNQTVRTVIGLPGYPCIAETKMNSYTVGDPSHCGIFLSTDPYGAAPAAGSALLFGRIKNGATDGIFLQSTGGAINFNAAVTTLPIWLRFRVGFDCYSCSIVWADYSTDGTTWTNVGGAIVGYPTAYTYNMATGVFDKVWGANPAISVPFEYFKTYRDLGPG